MIYSVTNENCTLFTCTVWANVIILLPRQKLAASRASVEEQLVFWEQIHAGKDELSSWLDAATEKLEQSVLYFGDSSAIQAQLQKYKVTFR